MPEPLPDSGSARSLAGRLRRKVVSRLGGVVPTTGGADGLPPDSLALNAALTMLYPSREASDLHAPAHALVGDAVVDLHGLRQILSTFDRQFFPSPVTVRFGPDDIVTHRLDNGITLFLDREDGAVSRPILAGDYEAHLVPVFERFCRPGMTVVDVGANVGLYSLLASRLVGSNGGLVSGDVPSLTSGWSEIVPTFALDDLVEGPVDFLKIDVEGAEGRVVAGAQRILKTSRPVVATELSLEMLPRVSGISGEEYLAGFEALGYRICLLNRGTGLPDPPTTAAQLLKDWADPLQIEDLLLLPPGD